MEWMEGMCQTSSFHTRLLNGWDLVNQTLEVDWTFGTVYTLHYLLARLQVGNSLRTLGILGTSIRQICKNVSGEK